MAQQKYFIQSIKAQLLHLFSPAQISNPYKIKETLTLFSTHSLTNPLQPPSLLLTTTPV
jgi:hypothetical protein